jgi:hypothetical protein
MRSVRLRHPQPELHLIATPKDILSKWLQIASTTLLNTTSKGGPLDSNVIEMDNWLGRVGEGLWNRSDKVERTAPLPLIFKLEHSS